MVHETEELLEELGYFRNTILPHFILMIKKIIVHFSDLPYEQ